jgi:hypothetical protein
VASIGSAPGLLAAAAVGAAASAALEPAFELPRQDAWSNNRNRILDTQLLARLVAAGGIDLSDANAEAHREGFSDDKFAAMVYLAQTVPGGAEAMHLWRLGLIGDDLFTHTLIKAGLDARYLNPIIESKLKEQLGLGDIAYAVVRGILPTPSYVPVPPPTTGDKVPRFPVVNVDPEELAARIGYDPEALQILVGRSGLSMAPSMAAQANFRNIIGDRDFTLAIAEGDLRTEWAEAVKEVSRQILTAGEYAELQLRGYYDRATRLTHTRKHGMSDPDSDLLYDVQGRGLSLHSAFIAERRGGVFNGPTDAIPDWAMFQLQRGNLRPEVYNLAWAGRESLPSAFVVRALLTGGAITAGEGETLFLHMGWPADLAKQVADFYGKATTAKADPHVTKAENQLWATLHSSYVKERTDDATATATLGTLGVAATAIPEVLALWQAEQAIVRGGLSAAQIKKAYHEATFTQPEAVARLVELGWSAADAAVYLPE